MKKQILFLLFSLAVSSAAYAAGQGPLQSLVNFQQQMVNRGSTLAMMELGKMYEQGTGTKQNLDKALELYRRAKAGGQAGADAAIARVLRLKKTLAEDAKLKKQQLIQQKLRAQQQKQAEAEQQAQLARAAKAKAARIAREKARQQALAIQRARLARMRAAQARANAERAARARAAAATAAQEKARQQAAQKEKPVQTAEKPAVVKKKTSTKKYKDTFESNPCKTAAASLLSLCH